MSSYAIRFLPADPKRRDEPALYLAARGKNGDGPPRLTAESWEVGMARTREFADGLAEWAIAEMRPRDAATLIADVVTMEAALADLRS